MKVPALVDQFPIACTLFTPPNSQIAKHVVQISSATGVKRAFYSRFAQYLAGECQCVVVTYDYRGVGESLPFNCQSAQEALVQLKYSSIGEHWAVRDQGGVSKFIVEQYPKLQFVLIGHSAGCHIAPMNPYLNRISRMLFISGNSAYWGHSKTKLLSIAFPAYVALSTRMYEYFAATKVQLCEDLPSGVGYDWARWSRHAEYCTIDEPIRRAYEQFYIPSVSLCFDDDHFCYKAAFSSWCGLFSDISGRRPQLRYVESQKELGVAVDHMGFFFDTHKERLWMPAAQWLLEDQKVALLFPALSAKL